MFVKELDMYVDFLKDEINSTLKPFTEKQLDKFDTFRKNLLDGIEYYKNLLSEMTEITDRIKAQIKLDLAMFKNILDNLPQLQLTNAI